MCTVWSYCHPAQSARILSWRQDLCLYQVLEFMIVNGNIQNVLGRKPCSELKMVKRVDRIGKCITDDYPDMFDGLGCIKDATIHHIKLDENVKPDVHPPLSQFEIKSEG